MIRLIYTTTLIGLIGSTAWAAAGLQGERHKVGAGAGLVLIAALQR